MFALSFSGVVAALPEYAFLTDEPTLIASLMLFSGGGIRSHIVQDIAPSSRLTNTWLSALGASAGFSIGMIGQEIPG